ncbi:MAG TPA: zf-HC2 domain-containing protein [Pyrinomonadaceae bacterium]|nr:zf-HC2 domain-containing protein [Pyrinomonadaceae bacterium]
MSTAKQKGICERDLFAAYVDGELDAELTVLFEEHLESCEPCDAELRAHRLFVCELDAAMTDNVEIPVPADFSKMVATRAATDMRGVRTRSEHRRALGICIVLALAGFALLGATARDAVFAVGERFVTASLSLGGFLSGVVYDAGAAVAVIFGVLSRKLIVETGSLVPLLVLLAFAILILSRLISDYHHRAGATE